jgi:hypothetical protein
MDPERDRIRRMVEDELPGHSVIFEEDDKDNNIRFQIQDGSGTIVSRGKPAFHRAEIRKWSDSDLRLLIRFVCGGNISQ